MIDCLSKDTSYKSTNKHTTTVFFHKVAREERLAGSITLFVLFVFNKFYFIKLI